MKKEMIKRISSIFFALVLTFMSAAVPAMNVHATEAGTVLSIQALMQSILLAGGMNTSGYKYTTSGAKQDFRLLMSAILGHGSATDTARINRMMKQAQELETDSFKKQLEDAEDGSTFEYEDFKISKKAANDYKLYVSQKAVGDMSALIKNYAKSSDNEYTASAFSSLEDSFNVTYDNYVKRACPSINDIADYYSSDVVKVIKSLGYDDSNCMVVARNWSYYTSQASKWNGHVTNGQIPDKDGLYTAFIIIPFGASYVDVSCSNYYNSSISYRYHNAGGFCYDSARFFSLSKYLDNYGESQAFSYIRNSISGYDVVYYVASSGDISSFHLDNDGSSTIYPYWNNSDKQSIFNFVNAFNNKTFYIYDYYISDMSMRVQSLDTVSHYVSESTSKKYDNTADYVEMEFNSDTSAKLDSYENVGELLNYVSSLSKQLSDLKDAISDSNKEQTGQIISSIESQTKIVSDGIAEVVTTVKAQTDAISDVTDAVNAQTGALQDVLAGINDQTLAITDPLKDILSELRDLSITLPKDLTISIPEDKLNVNVAIPDISAEVINNIEVKQDYKALQDTISDAMSGTLADVFVPSAPVVDAMVDNYHHKFGFVDDIRTNMDNVKKTFMGITPTPYLKIPIMKTKSAYDYGFGDYFILDLSWYAVYKPYGDKIISAFMWLFFIWRMFIKLPGIINGAAAGTVMTIDTIGSVPKGTDADAWGAKKDGEFGASKWLM